MFDGKMWTCWKLLGLVPDVQSTLRGHKEIIKKTKTATQIPAQHNAATLQTDSLSVLQTLLAVFEEPNQATSQSKKSNKEINQFLPH